MTPYEQNTADVKLIHLTLCGVEAGRCLCDCDRSNQPEGTKYWHAAYAPKMAFDDPRLCRECLAEWNASIEEENHENAIKDAFGTHRQG
jgi:hypothetical protein